MGHSRAVRISLCCLASIFAMIFFGDYHISRYPSYHYHDDFSSLNQLPVCSNKCLWRTGANGTWHQDWKFAQDHGQYHRWVYPNGKYLKKRDNAFRPSPESPYPWRTSWKWNPSDSDADCQVEIMTDAKLCDILFELDIFNILFYGDSLTQQMYTTFMNRLGDAVNVERRGFEGTINCARDPYQFKIRVLHERDEGGNAFPKSPRGVYKISNRSQTFISSSVSGRTLGIFNIGAHYHNMSHYIEDMSIMLQSILLLNRTHDIYFFRSTSPGHPGCEPQTKNFDWSKGAQITPLKSYSEYKSGSLFDWERFEEYNAYAKNLVQTHNKAERGAPIHFLNIWNMTVLRRDAHTAPADCLHYHDPGPVDWWNHLLFTYLDHLSNGNGNCRRLD